MKRYYKKQALNNAKLLRQTQTDTELILWSKLRNRSLNGIKFRRQVPIDKYIADFVASDKKLIIELLWERVARMCRVRVLAFTPCMIFKNSV